MTRADTQAKASPPPANFMELLNAPKIGRPSKLNEFTKKALYNAILRGNTIKDACAVAGIGVSTYERWRVQAEDDIRNQKRSDYREFWEVCQKVFDMAKPLLVNTVGKGAENDPYLALKILERRYPREWGRCDTIEMRDITGEPEELSDDDIIRHLYQNPETADHIHALIESVNSKPRNLGESNK